MTNADFYLEIARQELDQLKHCAEPVVVGSKHSDHFHHAVVSSIFSAFTVEYALTELVWAKCFFQTPEPHRRISLLYASRMRTIPEKLEFVRKTTKVPNALISKIQELFDYRNRIAHCHIKAFEGKVLDFDSVESLVSQGRGDELDTAIEQFLRGDDGVLRALTDEGGKESKSLNFDGMGTRDLEAAEENFQTARTALKALRKEAGISG